MANFEQVNKANKMQKKTFARVVKEIVIASVDLSEHKGQTLRQVFECEYGHNGHSPQVLHGLFAGLA